MARNLQTLEYEDSWSKTKRSRIQNSFSADLFGFGPPGVRHITNITDNASRGKEVYPDVRKLEEQNLEKTELTFPQPRRWDRNYNEETGMVLLKIGMHCLEGCIPQTRKTIMKFPGVESVKVDKSKDLAIVAGAPNAKELVAHLEKKLKRRVEVVLAPNENVSGDNKKVGVTKTQTLKGSAAAHEDGRNMDVEIKKEVKKEAKETQIKQKAKDAPAAAREDGRNKDVKIKREVKKEAKEIRIKQKVKDAKVEDKEDKKGNEGVEDKVKEAKGHGYVSHVGEADRQTKNQQPCSSDCWTNMFSDENPHSCAIM